MAEDCRIELSEVESQNKAMVMRHLIKTIGRLLRYSVYGIQVAEGNRMPAEQGF